MYVLFFCLYAYTNSPVTLLQHALEVRVCDTVYNAQTKHTQGVQVRCTADRYALTYPRIPFKLWKQEDWRNVYEKDSLPLRPKQLGKSGLPSIIESEAETFHATTNFFTAAR